MEIESLKESILLCMRQNLSRKYGLTSLQIDKLIVESEITDSIEKYPETMSHLNQDQLIDFVLD